MIEIKHGRDIQISQFLKKIVQYDDNFTKRIFKIPKIVDGVDISDYNFTLQVEPVNKENSPYFNLLEKQVNEADILLTWTVKLHDTKDYGKIRINIRVSDSNDKVFATYSGSFEIVKSIDTDKQGEILPPSYIEQGLDQMQGMLDNANDTRDYVDGLANEITNLAEEVDGNTIEVREKTQEVYSGAQQISEDKGVIEGWKIQVEDSKNIVVEKSDNVDLKYPIIIEKSNNIDEKYPIILHKSDNVDNKHSEVVSKSDNVDFKYPIIIEKSDNVDEKYPVVIEKSNNVDGKYSVIVEKSNSVDTKHDEVVQLAGQVEADRQEVVDNTQTVADNLETVLEKAAEALQSAANALASEENAHTSAGNAEESETSALGAMGVAVQAMTDLLAMMGEDIATLTNGKLTPSQIPPLSINDVFEVDSIEEMLQLTAERGDVALVLLDENIHDSYMLSTDEPSLLDNWKKLGVSYVANAGHALTSDNAENANKINNKRLVSMTESQYEVAVKDESTFYAVVPDEVI